MLKKYMEKAKNTNQIKLGISKKYKTQNTNNTKANKSKKYKIIGIGALLYDKIYVIERLAHSNESIGIRNVYNSPGGSVANTIFWLGKYGYKSAFFGSLGDDKEGKNMADSFKDASVALSYINTLKNSLTDFALTFVDDKENRTFYTYIKLDNILTKKNLDKHLQTLKQSEWFFISPHGDKQQIKLVTLLVEKFKKSGGKIAFSIGVWYKRKLLDKLISISDVVFLNRTELAFLTGTSERDFKKGIVKLRKMCKGIIVNTRGKEGAYVFDEKGKEYFIPTRARKVVDTTGCGDAFAAGFLNGLFKGSIKKGIENGTNLSAEVIERYGARNGVGCINFKSGRFKCKK